mgnify:CR=1 FL=1
MNRIHRYTVTVTWTGDRGTGTSAYAAYGRDHTIEGERKTAPILGSSTPKYRGDVARYNPEELLVGALSTCHMLWYLHLCADRGVAVRAYRDEPEGSVRINADGSGEFVEVLLRPRVTIEQPDRAAEAIDLHSRAHEMCFIARSVNFPVRCDPSIT